MLQTMKQVTGSNNPVSEKKVSIQRSLDGHSFSVTPRDFDADHVSTVEVLSPQTMLVPGEVFGEEDAAALLAANGTPAAEGDVTVWSDATRPVIAVMALPAAALGMHDKGCSLKRFSFTTPLLHTPVGDKPLVWMCRRAHLLYIKVYGPELQLAEVIVAPEVEDVTYFIERLSGMINTVQYNLQLSGDDDKSMRRAVAKRFKSVTYANY